MASLLQTTNLLDDVRAVAEPLLAQLSAKPETAAVGVLGGGARGGNREFVDAYSDIDLTLLIDIPLPAADLELPWPSFIHSVQQHLPAWLPSFKFRDTVTGLEFNIHQHLWLYEVQPRITWDNGKCEAYVETLEVVYDPLGKLAELVAAKASGREDRAFGAAVELLTYDRNLIHDGLVKCLRRGRPDAAADAIEQVISRTIDVVFFTADYWPPHPKWRMIALEALASHDHMCASVFTLVSDWRTGKITVAATREMLLDLFAVIERCCSERFARWPEDVYRYAIVEHFTDRQLRRVTGADCAVGDKPYADCLASERWNSVNWHLGAAADAAPTGT
jgi:hypothetical protein